ncbi:ABC transporter ATP-binding protein [Halovenus salina]|nr:ABC transporter ATP-binding protein [Halovenus salina]
MSLIDVSDLAVFYGKSQVVNEVSFSVDPGELVSIVGPNGAGKTSILESLVNYTDWRGDITLKGDSIKEMSADALAKMGLSYCREEENIFPYMSVRQNLLLGGHLEQSRVKEHLETVYELFPILEERTDQRADTLSGGQQQMLAIGISLMSDPDLLVLDEPTLGLAPVVVDDIAEAIDRLRKRDLGILLVEQNVNFGFKHADRVILMETGEIVRSGSPAQLREDDYVSQTFFGMSSTEAT